MYNNKTFCVQIYSSIARLCFLLLPSSQCVQKVAQCRVPSLQKGRTVLVRDSFWKRFRPHMLRGSPGGSGARSGSQVRVPGSGAQGSMRKASSLSECWLLSVRRSGSRSSSLGNSVLSSGRRRVMSERRALIKFS